MERKKMVVLATDDDPQVRWLQRMLEPYREQVDFRALGYDLDLKPTRNTADIERVLREGEGILPRADALFIDVIWKNASEGRYPKFPGLNYLADRWVDRKNLRLDHTWLAILTRKEDSPDVQALAMEKFAVTKDYIAADYGARGKAVIKRVLQKIYVIPASA